MLCARISAHTARRSGTLKHFDDVWKHERCVQIADVCASPDAAAATPTTNPNVHALIQAFGSDAALRFPFEMTIGNEDTPKESSQTASLLSKLNSFGPVAPHFGFCIKFELSVAAFDSKTQQLAAASRPLNFVAGDWLQKAARDERTIVHHQFHLHRFLCCSPFITVVTVHNLPVVLTPHADVFFDVSIASTKNSFVQQSLAAVRMSFVLMHRDAPNSRLRRKKLYVSHVNWDATQNIATRITMSLPLQTIVCNDFPELALPPTCVFEGSHSKLGAIYAYHIEIGIQFKKSICTRNRSFCFPVIFFASPNVGKEDASAAGLSVERIE